MRKVTKVLNLKKVDTMAKFVSFLSELPINARIKVPSRTVADRRSFGQLTDDIRNDTFNEKWFDIGNKTYEFLYTDKVLLEKTEKRVKGFDVYIKRHPKDVMDDMSSLKSDIEQAMEDIDDLSSDLKYIKTSNTNKAKR